MSIGTIHYNYGKNRPIGALIVVLEKNGGISTAH